MTYSLVLTAFAAIFLLLETLAPWRRAQRQRRTRAATDLAYFVFNGYFLGAMVYGLVWRTLLPLAARGLGFSLSAYQGPAASWPLWAQIAAAVLLMDLTQWLIHNLLHRVSWLWELHKVHHSIQDDEMDLFAAFRFHWSEGLVYALLQLPVLVFFGFSGWAIFAHSILGTFWNYLNHANLNLGRGAWRYVLNSPRMHLWHHDADATRPTNLGVIFSLWDHLFGTARIPEHPPARLGFHGDQRLPRGFLGMSLWPMQRLYAALHQHEPRVAEGHQPRRRP